MADSPLEDIADTVKDVAYVSVGLGVIALQRLQVRRNELQKAVDERLRAVRTQLTGHVPGKP